MLEMVYTKYSDYLEQEIVFKKGVVGGTINYFIDGSEYGEVFTIIGLDDDWNEFETVCLDHIEEMENEMRYEMEGENNE